MTSFGNEEEFNQRRNQNPLIKNLIIESKSYENSTPSYKLDSKKRNCITKNILFNKPTFIQNNNHIKDIDTINMKPNYSNDRTIKPQIYKDLNKNNRHIINTDRSKNNGSSNTRVLFSRNIEKRSDIRNYQNDNNYE